ncbi:MAG: KamA family radical SAM protein [Clostridiaceae bacterium]|nr:KamA family radical SAM protein [Clostridiaceae bacterium]
MIDYRNTELWKNVTEEQWHDWKWQLKNRIQDTKTLSKIIHMREEDLILLEECLKRFRMAVTPYYACLITPSEPGCPVKAQCIPSAQEMQISSFEMEDPLGEVKYAKTKAIVHKYPDRVLFLLTGKCAMYCRHCTRRRFAGSEDFVISEEDICSSLDYIKSHTEVRDVLLSGGDPFTLSDRFLESIIRRIREIPHVEIIRIGTRTPVVIPMRITEELVGMLRKYHPVWINTHFNHPNEITDEAAAACARIVDAGIPLGNQTVLLKGVNDSAETIKELCLKLVKIRVRPYYLYQCDIAQGINHFRTPVEKGLEIMAKLRGYISGFAVPTFVIDAPGGGGKIPVNVQYIEEWNGSEIKLKNYKGEIYSYPNAGE